MIEKTILSSRDELTAIISEKETQALKDLPVDELRKMLQEVI